jgi:hypothetical protein
MERPSESGPAGIGIRGCSGRIQESHLALALALASSAGSVGDGDTGDTIGITGFFSITTGTYRTAEFSLIASTSIAPADFMEPADFMAEAPEDSRHTLSPVRIPVHSAALTMEESQEVSLLGGNRASAEASVAGAASTEAEVTGAEATGNSVQLSQTN